MNHIHTACFRLVVLSSVILASVLLISVRQSDAQGTQSEYERWRNFANRTSNKVFKQGVKAHWFADNSRFWYRNDLADQRREFVLVDVQKGVRQPAFDHERLTTVGVDRIKFFEEENAVWFQTPFEGKRCDLKSYELSKSDEPKTVEHDSVRDRRRDYQRRFPGPRSDRSPDKKWQTFLNDHNLYLRHIESDEEFRLTDDGMGSHPYDSRVFWSPDSAKFVAYRTKRGDQRVVHFVESSPKDQLQPKLHSHRYLKPGDKIDVTKPHLFHVADKKRIPISDELFPTPWTLEEVRWHKDSSRFTFRYNQRGHQVLRLIAVDAETGAATAIINEESKTFLDWAYKQYLNYVDETDELIWLSERDGWNHLYLYDALTGKVKNQITRGEWVVRGIDRVDKDARQIWFRASGVYPDQDPYYIHYCRVNFDGSDFVVMTRGDGTHSVRYSPDRKFLIDTYSRVDMAPVTELRRVSDGELVCELERGDMSALLEIGWQVPERFVAKGRDGKTDIYGVIFRPTNFDPEKKYPVIEKIYAGPHGSFVPKTFRSHHGSQKMAELGFIVVQIDGMGTSNRSKAFHNVAWKNVGDSGFPDRILWMKAAAKKYPSMDLTRVGIYGGSAGGQSSTRALLAHGDFYKVAVSDCGCHDNRMDKIWWNEQWMGWPIGPHYAEQSNVTQAHRLQGKLFLIVGELDRNVDPASTMQVVNALIKADKDFDLLVVPGGGHGIAESSYGRRRRADFFVRHLHGVEPRSHP